MAGFMETMSKPAGPLPVGAWIVLVGGGLGFAYWSNKKRNQGVEIVEDVSTDPGVGVGGLEAVGPGGSPSAPGAPAITTNEEWGRQAINYLIADGLNAAQADAAIRRYLAGEIPTIQDTAMIARALAKFGAPPVPLPPVTLPTIPTGGTSTGAPSYPSSFHWVNLFPVGSVKLAWSPARNAVSYQIQSNSPSTPIYATSGNVITIKGLKRRTTYHWRIRSIGANGLVGAWSPNMNTYTP